MPDSTLKIFTLSMHWVKSETGGGASPLTWNLTNDAGQRVASGYYFFLVTNWPVRQRSAWNLLEHYRQRDRYRIRQ